MTFKPSAYLLNVNNGQVSRQGEYFRVKNVPSVTDVKTVGFWIYVSEDWFPNNIIDNVFLFNYDGTYFCRVYTDECGLVWLELYQMKLNINAYYKNSVSVLLEGFSNRWHFICITIPDSFYDVGDYAQIYYDGVLQHRNIVHGVGNVTKVVNCTGFTFGYNQDIPIEPSVSTFNYASGDFIGYVFDLFLLDCGVIQQDVDYIYNCGVPWTEWITPFNQNFVFWSILQDRGFINKRNYILDNKYGDYRLQFISSMANKLNVAGKSPTMSLLSEEQIHLAKTRNNNKFKSTTIPNYDFQNSWIINSAAQKSRFYDTQGLNTDYEKGTERTKPVEDNTYKILTGSGSFSKFTSGGIAGDYYLSFTDENFGIVSKTGLMTGKLYFLLKILNQSFPVPDMKEKSSCFVEDFLLLHSKPGFRLVESTDTYPNYLSGPITDPPLAKDIDDIYIQGMSHSGDPSGDIVDLRINIPNFSGADETVFYEYSYFIIYTFVDTTAYIPLV